MIKSAVLGAILALSFNGIASAGNLPAPYNGPKDLTINCPGFSYMIQHKGETEAQACKRMQTQQYPKKKAVIDFSNGPAHVRAYTPNDDAATEGMTSDEQWNEVQRRSNRPPAVITNQPN
jgi:hypothetical protein